MAIKDLPRITPAVAGVVVAAILAAAAFATFRGDETPDRTLTAHFSRAVSVYPGTDVRILGVNVGRVTSVTPDGDSVRVDIAYDPKYKVPAEAKAVIVTPTLIADRYLQLTPAWRSGAVMADGADIPLPDTGVPVELDRIYSALSQLSVALGPNGVNKDGTLNHLLTAGAAALDGQGELGNQMIRDLGEAAATFGEGSNALFDTVTQLARFTQVLAGNDKLVRVFMEDLAAVSSQLAGERQELRAALSQVADSVGTVQRFVGDNRRALNDDLERLTRTLKTINSEKDSIDDALRTGPVALGNLSVAFDVRSGTIGARFSVGGNFGDLDGFLCAVVQQSDLPTVSKKLACNLFEQSLEPILGPVVPGNGTPGLPDLPGVPGKPAAARPAPARTPTRAGPDPRVSVSEPRHAVAPDDPQFAALLGGAR